MNRNGGGHTALFAFAATGGRILRFSAQFFALAIASLDFFFSFERSFFMVVMFYTCVLFVCFEKTLDSLYTRVLVVRRYTLHVYV